MPVADLSDWLVEFSRDQTIWYIKRLAANDTLATGSHQAGPYVPKDLLFEVFPSLDRPTQPDPEVWVDAYLDSHADHKPVRVVWYNGKLFGTSTRNEARITRWGGSSSAMLDPESTGALTVFVFTKEMAGLPGDLHVWICNNALEEDLVEDRFGPVEPGSHAVWRPGIGSVAYISGEQRGHALSCRLSADQMPPEWLKSFPAGLALVRKSIERRPLGDKCVDERLLQRRECEFELFRSVEEVLEGPRIASGFSSLDEFISFAQTVLQRRKSRSGRSLELHARELLIEEGLVEGVSFSHQPESESGKRPDFLFPSGAAYRDPTFATERLRFLATKTTCKDRWRQVLNEADRIQVKHLLTLQEGVSATQFAEMRDAGVRLVVPAPLMDSYPAAVRTELISLQSFIAEARHLRLLS